MWEELAVKVVEALLPVLVSLLVVLIGYGVAYLRRHIAAIDQVVARQALDAALAEAQAVAIDAVRATNQRFVDDLKAARADGKLTPEEARQALRQAQNYFVTHLSKESLRILEAALGPVEDWLGGMIEAKVSGEKSVQARIKAMARPN